MTLQARDTALLSGPASLFDVSGSLVLEGLTMKGGGGGPLVAINTGGYLHSARCSFVNTTGPAATAGQQASQPLDCTDNCVALIMTMACFVGAAAGVYVSEGLYDLHSCHG